MTKSKKLTLLSLAVLGFAGIIYSLNAPKAGAHCQIPCGIYDDPTVFQTLYVDVKTIHKSMKEIEKLSERPGKNANQICRWVINKENHADKFTDMIVEYFMQQRIHPKDAKDHPKEYYYKLRMCHEMLVTAMKCKQTTEVKHALHLKELLTKFKTEYNDEKGDKTANASSSTHKHEHEHDGHKHSH